MTPTFKLVRLAPPISDFIELRNQVGWCKIDVQLATKSLENSLFHVSVYDQSKLVGAGRVIGDGYMYFYIQDVIVDPRYQGKGVGSLLMNEIELYLAKTTSTGSTVGLLAAKGKESFYLKYGYLERTGNPLGNGMCKFI